MSGVVGPAAGLKETVARLGASSSPCRR